MNTPAWNAAVWNQVAAERARDEGKPELAARLQAQADRLFLRLEQRK
jgi:hypothetical protein